MEMKYVAPEELCDRFRSKADLYNLLVIDSKAESIILCSGIPLTEPKSDTCWIYERYNGWKEIGKNIWFSEMEQYIGV